MGWKKKRGGQSGKGKGGGRNKGVGAGSGKGGENLDECDEEDSEVKRRKLGGRLDVWRDDPDSWDQTNASFEDYYQKQRICPEEDWPRLLEVLRTGLPAAIRVNRMRAGAHALCGRLEELQQSCGGDPERHCYAPTLLAWYPHALAWQWPGLERRVIKKDRRHVQLKDYLAQRERCGLISRQEVVSMLPPLFLEIESHHLVLDLCAAPGSKTSQMLEVMHWPQAEGGEAPQGLVLANELQWKRANTLAHQVNRLGSPCVAVVNMDAQFFPGLVMPNIDEESGREELFRFDRVLCDVPCSGDGTMRKTPHIWSSWKQTGGLSLHIRQLNILNRGLDVLKIGGRLVYSTCSLNPMENESVVAAALVRNGSAIRLVSPPSYLDQKLQTGRGLQEWVVPHPYEEGKCYRAYDEVQGEMKEWKLKLLPSMFPPSTDGVGAEIRAALRESCRRLLPHLMDTGGFFVAVFEKLHELPPSAKARREARKEERSATNAQLELHDNDAPACEVAVKHPLPEMAASKTVGPETSASPSLPHGKILRRIAEEYVALGETIGPEDLQEIVDFYGLDPAISSYLFVRERSSAGAVFLLSAGARRLLYAETKLPTRMVLCGVLALQRSSSHHVRACSWCLAQEGIAALCALGLRRRLALRCALLRRLLEERELPLTEIQAAATAGDVAGLEAIADTAAETPTGLRPGSLALTLLCDDKGGSVLSPTGGLPVAVVANISDDALELAAGSVDASALLEDLCGQPSVEEILGPAGGILAEADQGSVAVEEGLGAEAEDEMAE